jgi:signal peptidase II
VRPLRTSDLTPYRKEGTSGMSTKYKMFALALVLALGLDQGTKIWARAKLKPKYPDVVTVIPKYFEMRYSENTGAAFGMFRGIPYAQYGLLVVGVAALFIIGSTLKKAEPDRWRIGAELGLLTGGALGNIIDRVAFNKVTDFVVWRVGVHEWPTFNIADAALVVGVLGLLIDMRPDEKATAKAAPRS